MFKRIDSNFFLRARLCFGLGLIFAAVAYGQEEIVAHFEGESPSKKSVDDCPGKPGEGWMTPWLKPAKDGVVTLAIEDLEPLDPSGGKYLNVEISAKGNSSFYGAVSRGYDGGDTGVSLSEPHSISFRYRLESELETDQWLTLFASGQRQASTDRRCTWIIRGSEDGWHVVNGNRDGGVKKEIATGVRIRPGQVYEFTISVNPQDLEWEVSIDDGSKVYRSGALGFRAAGIGGQGDVFLGFGVQAEEGSSPVEFSLDELQIVPTH